MEGNTEENIIEQQRDGVLEYVAWLKKKYRSHVHVFEREAGFGVSEEKAMQSFEWNLSEKLEEKCSWGKIWITVQ